MTKADARKALTALRKALVAEDPNLAKAERDLGSIQTRQGIRLARIAEVLGSRKDLPNFKTWLEKNYTGRSYGTLNRWKNAGTVAIALGFDETSTDLPPVMEVEPFNGLDDDVIQDLWAKSEKGKAGTTRAHRVATLAAEAKGTKPPKDRKNNTPTAPADSAGTVVVEYDAAELEARTTECGKVLAQMDQQLKRKAKDMGVELNPTLIRMARTQIFRLIRDHQLDIVGIVLKTK